MDIFEWAVTGCVAAVAFAVTIAVIALVRRRHRRQTARLRAAYGPEYEHSVRASGRSRAEADLVERERDAARYSIRPLLAVDAHRFERAWTSAQEHFVDSPGEALVQADRIVAEVLQARGYPVLEFAESVRILSVEHPRIAVLYRDARHTALRNQREEASTEEMRRAMLNYRATFNELAEVGGPAPDGAFVPAVEARLPGDVERRMVRPPSALGSEMPSPLQPAGR
jgi:hypothetical protein